MAEDEDGLQAAFARAHRYLNRRDRTVSEVREHLEGNGIDAAIADEVVRTLVDQRYLDDVRFARLFTEDKRELDQWGGERIRRGLLARGVERELAEDVLAGSRSSELERAVALLRSRFHPPPRDRRDRERALGLLLRKGYDSEIALDALADYARRESDLHHV